MILGTTRPNVVDDLMIYSRAAPFFPASSLTGADEASTDELTIFKWTSGKYVAQSGSAVTMSRMTIMWCSIDVPGSPRSLAISSDAGPAWSRSGGSFSLDIRRWMTEQCAKG